MSNQRRLRRGVVKQLSNLSIDEISTVDRGANQHSLIAIAKRAPQAEDYFQDVNKDWADYDAHRAGPGRDYWAPGTGKEFRNSSLGQRLKYKNAPGAHQQRKADEHESFKEHPLKQSMFNGFTGHGGGPTSAVVGGMVGGAAAGAVGGFKAGEHHGPGAALAGGLAGYIGGGAAGAAGAGKVVHNHFYGKRLDDSVMDVDALFDVSKKKSDKAPSASGSSFGRGGNTAGIDTFTGDDPSGVTTDPNGEDGDIGPDGTISGVETIEGEDMPPQKKKKVKAATDINSSGYDGGSVGKSADFWKNVVSKVLEGEEFETEDNDGDFIEKHFPGPPGAGGMQGQQPQMGGYGQPPMQQTVGAQPMGMGQPTAPPMGGQQPPMGGGMQQPGMAQGGMPQQLPPDVVSYIQQLEQALDQLTGGQISGDDDNSDQSSSQSSGDNSSSSSDNSKQNPFGKSLETSGMDETTFLTELSKALDDDDEREVINKALESVGKAEYRARQAETIAKAERDLRLEREFVAKAAEFNLPIKSSELGPVLKRAAEALEEEDFKTIVKCLRSSSAQADFSSPFSEVGKRGGGDNADVLSEVDAAAQELVQKGTNLTPEAATLQVLNNNPAAYDEYLRDKRQRQF